MPYMHSKRYNSGIKSQSCLFCLPGSPELANLKLGACNSGLRQPLVSFKNWSYWGKDQQSAGCWPWPQTACNSRKCVAFRCPGALQPQDSRFFSLILGLCVPGPLKTMCTTCFKHWDHSYSGASAKLFPNADADSQLLISIGREKYYMFS